jgi:hypothetical protein
MLVLFGRYPKQHVSHTVAIMNRTPLQPSHPLHPAAQASLFGALEWDALPPPPAPFAEPIHGLQVREIEGSTVFGQFFDLTAVSH